MSTVTVTASVKLDLRESENSAIAALCAKIPGLRKRLPLIEEEIEVDVDLDAVDDDDLLAEVDARGLGRGQWLERTYRYLAEGDVAAAMDEMQREFGLAPPSHECRIADLLAGLRN